jgi:putative membrane protein
VYVSSFKSVRWDGREKLLSALNQRSYKANQELTALASTKGVTLPADDPEMAYTMPTAKKSGAEFDKEFAMSIIDDHSKVIAAFEKEIASGCDPDVKAWAGKTLPTLREHLTEAQSLPK